jgi:hypothetical protein
MEPGVDACFLYVAYITRVCQFMYAFPELVSTVCRHFGGRFLSRTGTSSSRA